MKKIFSVFVFAIMIAAVVPSVAYAASQNTVTAKELVGYDISWPQCGKRLPAGQAFGIVGINGGNAANTNPCLAQQLSWANRSLGGTKQPKIQLYLNTANPGEVIADITTWPTNNTDSSGYTTSNTYRDCSGLNDLACSWQYGWNRAQESYANRFIPAAEKASINTSASLYTWWLDVETMNTWQSGTNDALMRNVAALEGMASYLKSQNAAIGLYSTAYQWSIITGNIVASDSILNNLPNWRPSGSSLTNALSNCTVTPLTSGGFISMTQYVQQNLDKNHSCLK